MPSLPQPLGKFFADRGPHLAAMIAYFALLSFVPLLFLTISLLSLAGTAGRVELPRDGAEARLPGQLDLEHRPHGSRDPEPRDRARDRRRRSALLWTSLSLFSVLESAFNIVYGQPNRSFLRGKLLAVGLMLVSLVTLFVGLLVGSFGFDLLKRYAAGVAGNSYVAYGLSVAVSLIARLRLPGRGLLPADERRALVPRRAARAPIVAAVVLEASFQVLPIYVRYSNNVVALKAFGGPALLLVWLYVMANVIVFGAEVNWRHARSTAGRAPTSKKPPASPRTAEQ